MYTYKTFIQAAYDGTAIDLTNATLKVAVCGADYDPDFDFDGDEFVSDLSDILAEAEVINAVYANGLLTWDGLDIANPESGPNTGQAAWEVLYIDDVGGAATSRLIAARAVDYPLPLAGSSGQARFIHS